jgi:transcriptional regulator with XRE-family HTH domain
MTREATLPDIGPRLGALRARRRLSQGTVARRSGIAPAHLSRIENGRVQPTFSTIWRILRAMDGELTEILDPQPRAAHGRCPLTEHGHCLLDLIRTETEVAREPQLEFYTPSEARLLHDLARWCKHGPRDLVRALDVLLHGLLREVPQEPAGGASSERGCSSEPRSP